MNKVEVSKLCKRYEAFSLSDVSFSLQEGHITGFVGRNGAGKTTTIKSMLNLVHPDSGSISYFGMPLTGNEKEIKQRIGYSTGTLTYYPKKKLKELAAVTKPFYESWDENACRKYLAEFGLDENKAPCEMSDGMKVKCNLLIALSHKAEVLILDEPTSGLDPFSRSELLEVFTMLKKNGVSVMFSTHIISDIEKCADDIILISEGKILTACPMTEFREKYVKEGETAEDAVIRLERGEGHD